MAAIINALTPKQIAALEAPAAFGAVLRSYLGERVAFDPDNRPYRVRSWLYSNGKRKIEVSVDAVAFPLLGLAEEGEVLAAFDSTPT